MKLQPQTLPRLDNFLRIFFNVFNLHQKLIISEWLLTPPSAYSYFENHKALKSRLKIALLFNLKKIKLVATFNSF